jgi:hypothetical protein
LLLGLWVCGQGSCFVHKSTGLRCSRGIAAAEPVRQAIRILPEIARVALAPLYAPSPPVIGRCQAKKVPVLRANQLKLTSAEGEKSARWACTAACVDEASCRMFLCARCRSQVLVCTRCDRGQIYCFGTCAQEARCNRQREARRRYQATPRGRAMHADRNRRYRARRRCVTDQGPAKECKAGSLLGLRAITDTSGPSASRKSAGYLFCHHCGRSVSVFLRLSALRPEYHRRK